MMLLQVEDAGGNDKKAQQAKKEQARGRGKGRGRGQYHHNNPRNGYIGTPPSTNSIPNEQTTLVRKQPPGPRMPDGTKGFAMGRGKAVIICSRA